MTNSTKGEGAPPGLRGALPIIGPALALVFMLVVAAIAAPAVMMMMMM